MADYAIHDTTLIGTSNIIRKKEGSSALIDPADYADRINLMGMLEEKTATGSIATFSDGADDVPIKSWEVALSPSLDGYLSVDVVSTGKNLVDASTIENGYQININSGLPTAWNGRCATTSPIMIHGGNITVSFSSTDSLVRMMYSFFKNGTFVERVANIESGTTINAHDYDTMYIGFANVNGVAITKDVLSNIQIEVGSTATEYEPYTAPTTATVSLGRTVYGGTADVVNGTGTDENGDDFTFEPVEISSRLGNNTMWSDSGDTEVTYRSSGTMTPVVPTLISKIITANGTYSASDDGVDGYDAVAVNVAQDESAFLVNDSDWSTNGLTYSKTVTIEEAGDYKIEWSSYSDQPTIQINGVTQTWTYSKSDRYAWYLSETVTLAVGDTISFSLNASGNNAFIAQVISLSYHGNEDDFLGIQDDYTRFNVQNLYSSVYIENGAIKRQIVFQLNTGSGYEGFCVSLDRLGLIEGQTYTLSFILDVPSTVTFSGSYQWGMKHSTSRLPTSGSANSNTFNQSTVVDFAEHTGTQKASITFTAGATNYLIVLLARIAGSRTEWIKMRDVQIEEASTPSLLSMMPSEEVNDNEEVEENEQNDIEG